MLLLALDHHHLAHLLLGVDLMQHLLPQLLQKVFLIQDESIASDLKVPTCKLDSSAPFQWPESVIVILPGCIPKAQVDNASIDLFIYLNVIHYIISFSLAYLHISRIVVKHSWDILVRKRLGCITDQEASFSCKYVYS